MNKKPSGIINTLKASKGAEWLEARRREYEGYGYKDGEIDSEIAADFFGAAVTQKEFERQIKAAELNKSFAQKIIDKVKEVVAELKEIMQKLRGQRLIYDAALDTDAETLDFFVDNLERILNQAGTETKNTATEDGVKYQLKVGAAADVEKALKDKNYRDDVYLTESSPAVIANQNGVRNLPMLMKASHIRENVFTEDEARQHGLKVDKNINYHGLGKDLFLKIIDGLDDVQYAYRGTKNADNPSRRENYFLLISQYKDGDGNTINVPVFINEQGQYNRVFIETNKIATVFGRNDMLAYLQREVKKGNLVRIKNKSTQASERTTPIVAGYSLNASVDTTVTQKSPSVNSILSENPKKITTVTKNTAENSGVKRQNKISVEMNDAERAEVLRNSAIDIVKYKGNVEDLNAANVLALQETYRANAAPVLKKLAEKFGVFDKTYFNKNISLDFSYSRGSLKESVNKQGKVSTDFYDFAKMLYVFDDVVNNAVPIEAHTDKYAGTERANQNLKYDYVLLSAFSDGDYIIPVEMHIKEFSNKDPNKLYVSITLGKIKTEDGILAHPSKQKNVSANVTPPSSKINVAQLISKVNPGFSDFYKYIPSELLTEAQISSKTVALDDEKYRLGVLRGEDVSGMLRKKAEKAGYSPDDSWKMDHRAPNADDDTAHNMAEIDAAYGGDGSIYSAQAAYYYGEGRSYDRNAIRVIQSARNNPDKQITVYRAVPADLKETRLRNGDWVAIVKQYAIEHGNRVLDGNFKIIEMTVPAKYLYGNGDSINEWGYDNGNRNEVYKNTANNVKTLEVTYDNSGELIPLSKRYDERKNDIRFQRKLPDVQEKLKKMSGSDDIDDVKRMAYGLADDFMKYAKAARLEMTETRGLMPQPTRISEIVAKYNDYRKTGISNKQLESDITDIFTDYMNGVGSSGTLFNYITDTIMKRELNSYEVIGDETFKAVRAYTDGGRFKVSDATVGSLVDTFGSLGEINGILRENYGFTIAKETDTRAEARAVWAPVGAQLAEEAGYVFDGTDYTENAKDGFEYETLASLLQTAQNDPRIYRGWLTGANTPDERILAQDELADRVEEEALKMYGELMSAPARNTKADRYRKMLFDYSVKHAAQLDRLENRLAENKLHVGFSPYHPVKKLHGF